MSYKYLRKARLCSLMQKVDVLLVCGCACGLVAVIGTTDVVSRAFFNPSLMRGHCRLVNSVSLTEVTQGTTCNYIAISIFFSFKFSVTKNLKI